MIPYNCTIAEAFRYHRNLITDDDIQVALDDAEHTEEILNHYDIADLDVELDQLITFRDDNEERLKEADENAQFVRDVRAAFEDRHGKIYDTPLEKLAQWVGEDIDNAPDSDTLIIHNVDLDMLESQRLELTKLLATEMPESQREALEGVVFMLEVWSDGRIK